MRQIDILLTNPLEGGHDSFAHGDLKVVFHPWRWNGPLPLLDGRPWAFVDWLLPELSGLELCRRLRCDLQTEQAHVTMILEEDDAEAKRRAMRAGADDYIVGPIDRGTVLDRVLSVQLPEREIVARTLRLGDLSLDLTALQARWKDKAIALMPNELRLLRYLMEQPGQVFSRAQLIAALGKQTQPIDERTVDAWVSRLRRALREVGAGYPLRTVRALGYVLDKP
ncbi:response regulator transcription factor [Novosphingobium pituita]|jgi:two-component system phosphate regulon response regulator PhoB|uniref:Phosphate regulon transcriptional regulator PhoB n=1 Tax=Novosphingobium pituita TaxID=3056842 RepID=A0ABQ6P5E1_9SPHN|nr:response regulator transcription factor [Novosphingobium sp. IK01]MDK4805024.1 response regulator transcription factor [Novosphingobium aromaticivorans]GMM60315.1 phosphate regulon transcriptional regulator PhoB [Novosphingobium sp. IK01]HIQ19069.1 response regulator transcription factor [Novosphingobium capsulatum]